MAYDAQLSRSSYPDADDSELNEKINKAHQHDSIMT